MAEEPGSGFDAARSTAVIVPGRDRRTRLLLEAPIAATLVRLARQTCS